MPGLDDWRRRAVYPLAAVRGQERLKTALLLLAVDPGLGGLLIRGEKGTAKSTTVRGLADLLSRVARLEGGGDPVRVLDCPLNATEDRLVGGLDWESAVRSGRIGLSPGLLVQADGHILFVDEVNLLAEHLVDALLDAASSGVVRVEREGVSAQAPSRFVLVGAMNPEEGDLRPQFLDRFGLCVEVRAEREVEARVDVLTLRERFDADPAAFIERFGREMDALAFSLARAKALFPLTALSPEAARLAVRTALEAGVAGHRADLAIVRTARALAALDGRRLAGTADIERAADYVLLHRRRPEAPPQDQPPPPPEKDEHNKPEPPPNHEHPQETHPPHDPSPHEQQGEAAPPEDSVASPSPPDRETEPSPAAAPPKDTVFEVGEPFAVKAITFRPDRLERAGGSGRRARTRTKQAAGRHVRSRPDSAPTDLDFCATIRAAAPRQAARRSETDGADVPALRIAPGDLHRKVREKRVGSLFVFCVDASGSMGAQRRMIETKGAVLSLLLDAYKRRDRVALIAFRETGAEVLLQPTGSVELAHTRLSELPVGGRTPLAAGIEAAYGLIAQALRRDPTTLPLCCLITDGRANAGGDAATRPFAAALAGAEAVADDPRLRGRVKSIVVDVERPGPTALGLSIRLAEALGARRLAVSELKAATLSALVRADADRDEPGNPRKS